MHAPQEHGNQQTGFAWGGRARIRWSEAWGVEGSGGLHPEGPVASLALVRFIGDPSADLVGHLAAGGGLQAAWQGFALLGGGFDVRLTSWLDLRADGRVELDTAGTAALQFTVGPMLHTRRVYDSDADGVPDRADACPHAAEDRDGFTDIDGCPDPDNDADGVPDIADGCPDAPEDPDGTLDKDGCPDPDDDQDGVFDVIDHCPSAPEDPDGWEDLDGCPDPDNDGDLVRDEQDQCSDVKEDPDGFADDDGCPDPDNDGDGVADQWDGAPLDAEVYNGWLDTDGVPDVVPPVLARVLGPLNVHFVGGVPVGDAVGLLAAVLASFPDAHVIVTVVGEPGVAAAHAEALRTALLAGGAAEGQVDAHGELPADPRAGGAAFVAEGVSVRLAPP
jgi:hypothetical protein